MQQAVGTVVNLGQAICVIGHHGPFLVQIYVPGQIRRKGSRRVHAEGACRRAPEKVAILCQQTHLQVYSPSILAVAGIKAGAVTFQPVTTTVVC